MAPIKPSSWIQNGPKLTPKKPPRGFLRQHATWGPNLVASGSVLGCLWSVLGASWAVSGAVLGASLGPSLGPALRSRGVLAGFGRCSMDSEDVQMIRNMFKGFGKIFKGFGRSSKDSEDVQRIRKMFKGFEICSKDSEDVQRIRKMFKGFGFGRCSKDSEDVQRIRKMFKGFGRCWKDHIFHGFWLSFEFVFFENSYHFYLKMTPTSTQKWSQKWSFWNLKMTPRWPQVGHQEEIQDGAHIWWPLGASWGVFGASWGRLGPSWMCVFIAKTKLIGFI